jgi:nucleotide-binding universal stress UspA family protein
MELYAIGVVGAIAVNLGSCVFNQKLGLNWSERSVMIVTSIILLAVELTLAKTKPNALFFIICTVLAGFGLRALAQRRRAELPIATALAGRPQLAFAELPGSHAWPPIEAGRFTGTVSSSLANRSDPGKQPIAGDAFHLSEVHAILVAARGWTPVLLFALEEARLRGAILYVLFVRVIAVNMPGPSSQEKAPRWQNDRPAAEIMYGVLEMASTAVRVLPVYVVSDSVAASVLDLAATLGVDMLILGAPQRSSLTALLRGDVVTEVARDLPETIQLIIHG